jgi:membrane-bound ClpP family serine protease
MGHAVNFDTLAYANKLKESGVPEKQAEAQSAALAEIFDYQAATKKDLQNVEERLSVKIDNKIAEVNGKIEKVNSDLNNKLLEVKTDLIRWTIGLLFAQSALLLSFLKVFH